METKILECKNLSKNIGKKQILKNVELEISEGDIKKIVWNLYYVQPKFFYLYRNSERTSYERQ